MNRNRAFSSVILAAVGMTAIIGIVGCGNKSADVAGSGPSGSAQPAKPISLEQRKKEVENNPTLPPQAKAQILQQMQAQEMQAKSAAAKPPK